MATNNLHYIEELIQFDEPNDFYFLQLIKRRKDHPGQRKDAEVVRSYRIESLADLHYWWDEIKMLCDHTGARAMFRINRRDYQDLAYRTMTMISEGIMQGNWKIAQKAFNRCAGRHPKPKGQKLWIVDIDGENPGKIADSLEQSLPFIRPQDRGKPGETKHIMTIPTKSGYHVITKPFDSRWTEKHYPDIEIKKDGATNLYIP